MQKYMNTGMYFDFKMLGITNTGQGKESGPVFPQQINLPLI